MIKRGPAGDPKLDPNLILFLGDTRQSPMFNLASSLLYNSLFQQNNNGEHEYKENVHHMSPYLPISRTPIQKLAHLRPLPLKNCMKDYGEHKTGVGSIKTAYVYDGIQRYS